MKLFFIIIIILLILVMFEAIRETTFFHTKYYTVETKKCKKDHKIIVIADLHDCTYGEKNEKLIKAIHRENPECIISCGDLTVGHPKAEDHVAFDLIKSLSADYPVILSNGNHEYRMKIYPEEYPGRYERYRSEIKKTGVTLLENQKEARNMNGDTMMFYGLEIGREYYQRMKHTPMSEDYISSLLGGCDPEAYTILLAHHPKYMQNYAAWGADLIVSGHYHGGIARIPGIGGVISPNISIFPKFDGGQYKVGHSNAIVSCGQGSHTIKLRFLNPPELSVITIKGMSDRK